MVVSRRRGGDHQPAPVGNCYCDGRQLATRRRCLLAPVGRLGPGARAALAPLLGDPALLKVGVNIHEDMAKLEKDYKLFTRGCCDIGLLSRYHTKMYGPETVMKELGYPCDDGTVYSQLVGLGRLARDLCGLALPKDGRVSRSNWDRPALSAAQLRYAALDGIVSKEAFEQLKPHIDFTFVNEKVWETTRSLLFSTKAFKKAARIASVTDDCFHNTFLKKISESDRQELSEEKWAEIERCPKTKLNEYIQKSGIGPPLYRVIRPPGGSVGGLGTTAQVAVDMLGEQRYSVGEGATVALAGRQAALSALRRLAHRC